MAERLGYADATNAMKQHCKGVVKRHPLQTAGGMQDARVLAESDVMRLIVGSKLPAAERFETWLFEEVLPSIRRTGSYGAPVDPMKALNDPALLGCTEDKLRLESAVASLSPKAAALDRIDAADGRMNVTGAALIAEAG